MTLPQSCGCWLIRSPGAGAVSIGSAPARCAALSTWAGRRQMYSYWLERHSTTEVPQPLRYLVGDVARRHGSIRVGPAGCYVRLADQAQAAALLAHPAASELGLRAVAPGVLVAAVDEDELVPLLRELGHTPAVENSAGEVIVTQPSRRATPQPAEPGKASLPLPRWPLHCSRANAPSGQRTAGGHDGNRGHRRAAPVGDARSYAGASGLCQCRRQPGRARVGAFGSHCRCRTRRRPSQRADRDHPVGPHRLGHSLLSTCRKKPCQMPSRRARRITRLSRMHAVTIRRMIVFGVCALGVGSLYLVPSIARSPEQIGVPKANDEPTSQPVGAQADKSPQSASPTGHRDSLAGRGSGRSADGGTATQSTAAATQNPDDDKGRSTRKAAGRTERHQGLGTAGSR